MIEIKNLTKKTSDKVIINSLSFSANGVFGICCDEAATKNTLLGMIAGVIPATEGTILVNGEEISSNATARAKTIGYLVEGAPVINEMTPYEFLLFVGQAKKIAGEKLHRQIEEVIELTALSDVKDTYLAHLNESKKKVLAIAQTLLGNPSVIVLNSPFEKLGSADRTMMKSIIEMLGEIKTVIISANRPADLADICGTVALISNGELKSIGVPEEVALSFTAEEPAENIAPETEDEKEGE